MKELEITYKIANIVSQSVIQRNLHQNHIPIKILIPADEFEFLCWYLGICFKQVPQVIFKHTKIWDPLCVRYLVLHSTYQNWKFTNCDYFNVIVPH